MNQRSCDLVLEGGGVKGIALVGAALALDEAGFRFERVAGSSAGAIVGSVIAAMQHAGEPLSRVDEIMRTLDYTSMLDRRSIGRHLRWWPRAADAWGALFHLGMYQGRGLTDWLRGVLSDLGVRTFGDLHFDDPDGALDPRLSYRLIVTASDLSRQRLIWLPRDLADYGIEGSRFPVATAVRASAAIPFMFEPVRITGRYGESTLVDGSLLRSYPIEIFDRTDGQPKRWPTIGIRLSSPAKSSAPAVEVKGPFGLLRNLIYTTVDSTQVRHEPDPGNVERSIFVKPKGVRWTDFDLSHDQQEGLFAAGHVAAQRWIATRGDNLD